MAKKEKKDAAPKDIMVQVYGPEQNAAHVKQPLLGTFVRGQGTYLMGTNKAGEVISQEFLPGVKLKKRKEIYMLVPMETEEQLEAKRLKRQEKKGKGKKKKK